MAIEKRKSTDLVKVDFEPIVIKSGYYNGLVPYKDASEAEAKTEEELNKKDTAVMYSAFLVISLLLLFFFPLISNYVKSVENAMYEDLHLMPEVTGMNEAEALLLLSDYEVIVEKVEYETEYFEDGVVTKANVDAGTAMNEDQVIKLYVCSKPDSKATKLESVVFPKFPITKNSIVFKSAELKDGVLYIAARNDGKAIVNFSVTIGQYDDKNELINYRRFFFKEVNVGKDELFEFKIRLINPRLHSFTIESAQRYS